MARVSSLKVWGEAAKDGGKGREVRRMSDRDRPSVPRFRGNMKGKATDERGERTEQKDSRG